MPGVRCEMPSSLLLAPQPPPSFPGGTRSRANNQSWNSTQMENGITENTPKFRDSFCPPLQIPEVCCFTNSIALTSPKKHPQQVKRLLPTGRRCCWAAELNRCSSRSWCQQVTTGATCQVHSKKSSSVVTLRIGITCNTPHRPSSSATQTFHTSLTQGY